MSRVRKIVRIKMRIRLLRIPTCFSKFQSITPFQRNTMSGFKKRVAKKRKGELKKEKRLRQKMKFLAWSMILVKCWEKSKTCQLFPLWTPRGCNRNLRFITVNQILIWILRVLLSIQTANHTHPSNSTSKGKKMFRKCWSVKKKNRD